MLAGAQEIADFTNVSDNKIKSLNLFYDAVKTKLLALRSWTFARKQAVIEAEKDGNGNYVIVADKAYKYEIELPQDIMELTGVYKEPAGRFSYSGYERQGRIIRADIPVLFIKYTANVPESEFPFTFRDLLANALAAEICYKLTGNKTYQEVLYHKVWGLPSDNLKGGLFGFYAKQDAAQNPAKKIESCPMTYARWRRVGK